MTFDPEDLKVGWVYLFHLRGEHTSKPHYGVVTRTEGDYCEVVYGQSHPDPAGDHVEVSPRKAQRSLHIPPKAGSNPPGPTYFRASAVVLVAVRNFIDVRGECADDQTYFKLEELAERARRGDTRDDQREYMAAGDSEPPPPPP